MPNATIPRDELRAELEKFEVQDPFVGRRMVRFAHLIAKHLKKDQVSAEGFLWACERALFDSEGEFEQVDRVNLRGDVPRIVGIVAARVSLPNMYDFVEDLEGQCREIFLATRNLD